MYVDWDWAPVGETKVDSTQVTQRNDARTQVFNYILANPFIHYKDVTQALKMDKATLDRNLRDLEGMGEIASRKESGTTYYIPVIKQENMESIMDDFDPYSAEIEGLKPAKKKPVVEWDTGAIVEQSEAMVEWMDWEDEIKIDELYIITKKGELMSHFRYKGVQKIDENVLANMLMVIQSFVRDSFSSANGDLPLKELVFEDSTIQVIPGMFLNLVAISSDEEPQELVQPLKDLLMEIEEQNEDVLMDDFDGNPEKLKGIQECVKKYTSGE